MSVRSAAVCTSLSAGVGRMWRKESRRRCDRVSDADGGVEWAAAVVCTTPSPERRADVSCSLVRQPLPRCCPLLRCASLSPQCSPLAAPSRLADRPADDRMTTTAPSQHHATHTGRSECDCAVALQSGMGVAGGRIISVPVWSLWPLCRPPCADALRRRSRRANGRGTVTLTVPLCELVAVTVLVHNVAH